MKKSHRKIYFRCIRKTYYITLKRCGRRNKIEKKGEERKTRSDDDGTIAGGLAVGHS